MWKQREPSQSARAYVGLCFSLKIKKQHFLMFQGKHEFDPETEEALLLGEDFDEEEEEDERSWKR